MAKDVVFESEKYMQRQEARRKWIPILCLAAVLLIIAVAALILRGSRGVTYTGGEDTPYPYSWSVNKKGEMTLDIARPEGYAWRLNGYDPGRMDVQSPEKQPENVSRFVLKADDPGRYIPAAALVNLEDPEDCLYEWRFLMDAAAPAEGETASAGPLSVISGSGIALSGKAHSAEEDAVAYDIHADAEGSMTIEIVNPPQAAFDASGSAGIRDKDEGDTVAEETRGEEDGGKPDESEAPELPPGTDITDPAEIEAALGMPYEEWVELQKQEAQPEYLYSYSWIVTSDNENAVIPVGIFYSGEMAIANLNAGSEEGMAAVLVSNDQLGLEVYVTAENKGGVLTVKEYGSRKVEPVPEAAPGPAEETAEPETAPEP